MFAKNMGRCECGRYDSSHGEQRVGEDNMTTQLQTQSNTVKLHLGNDKVSLLQKNSVCFPTLQSNLIMSPKTCSEVTKYHKRYTALYYRCLYLPSGCQQDGKINEKSNGREVKARSTFDSFYV